jgi:rhodanese-related sulfurtransferase
VRCGEIGRDDAEDVPLVVICHHGVRSFHATLWLRQHGFENALNLAGGIDAWASEIDTSMQRY